MRLDLPALRGMQSIGFMAAVGLLRIGPAGCRLGWRLDTQTAFIEGVDQESLLDHLVTHMNGRSASPELHLADDVRKYKLDDYRAACESGAVDSVEWVRCWWREDGDGLVPTDLCFTSGQQRFIRMARELAASLDPSANSKAASKVRGKFSEALFGPWSYADDAHSWGWDASTLRQGATTPEAPTGMPTEGVAGAYWLAWESQPLFPCVYGQGTLGFEHKPRAWTWPTWAEPLGIAAVRALVRQPDEAVALGGNRYRAGVTKAGHYSWFEPGRVVL
jgi:hypothetical protein